MGFVGEFESFISKGNVVELAVAVVMGVAFNNVVNGFVTDLITPLIGIPGHINFSDMAFTINGSTFLYGSFINAVISFVVISLTVFLFIVRPMAKLEQRRKAHAAPPSPTTKICPECLSTIPIAATRCAFCTAKLKK